MSKVVNKRGNESLISHHLTELRWLLVLWFQLHLGHQCLPEEDGKYCHLREAV